MRKVNKILVPIDFSDESASALKHALSLAMETRAELVALHVIEKSNDRDLFMASVAMLEGSPFPVNEFPTVPVDVLLRERSLDLWNFIGQNHRSKQSNQNYQESKNGQFAEDNDCNDSRRKHRPRGHRAARANVVSRSRGLEAHQNDPAFALSCTAGCSDRPRPPEPRKPLCWFQPTPRETPA